MLLRLSCVFHTWRCWMDCHNKEVRLGIRLAVMFPLILAGSGALMAQQCNQNPALQPVPCGVVDHPQYPNLTGLHGAINVTGWTLSQFTVNRIAVYREQIFAGE